MLPPSIGTSLASRSQQKGLAELVAANLTLDAIQPLLLGDMTASCTVAETLEPRYAVHRAQQRPDPGLDRDV